MNLVTTLRLDPPDPQELLGRIENFNSACNALSEHAFQSKTFGRLATIGYARNSACGLQIRSRRKTFAPRRLAMRRWSQPRASDKSVSP